MTFTVNEIVEAAKTIGVDGVALVNAILELQRVRGSDIGAVKAEALAIMQADSRNGYIAAVKRTRERLGYGLKEAVDFVNRIKQDNNIA